MTDTTRLSFVIPVRNDAARLDRCLRSILAQPAAVPFEIIVADNGSTDTSAQVARAAGAHVLSLPNRPVSEVRNVAAQSARGELLAFVDADHELGSGWMRAATGLFDTPSVWAGGANYHAPDDGTWVQRMYDCFRGHANGTHVVDWLPSGNLVVRRSAFERVQGFDTTLESCEDVDFCRRVRAAGGTLVESGSLRSVHHGDPRTLGALFFAELWRGRDNIRVSLRERLTPRSLPSIVIPVIYLLAMAAVIVSAVSLVFGGSPTGMLVGLALMVGLTSLRAIRMLARLPAAAGRLRHAPLAWLVAFVYDNARALALVVRVGHDVRRRRG